MRKIKKFLVYFLLSMIAFSGPRMYQSWIKTNSEIYAFTQNKEFAQNVLASYLQAQKMFKVNNYSSIDGNNSRIRKNSYCDNFRNLFYGNDEDGRLLTLIPKEFADAFYGPSQGAATLNNAPLVATPWNMTLFSESPTWNPEEEFLRFTSYLIVGGTVQAFLEIDSREPMHLIEADQD